MKPETVQRANDWVEVREALLARVASLDPVQGRERNTRPLYAHLLVALRRATITLIRVMIADDVAGGGDRRDGSDQHGEENKEGRPCFMWMGVNYLAKIWYVSLRSKTTCCMSVCLYVYPMRQYRTLCYSFFKYIFSV